MVVVGVVVVLVTGATKRQTVSPLQNTWPASIWPAVPARCCGLPGPVICDLHCQSVAVAPQPTVLPHALCSAAPLPCCSLLCYALLCSAPLCCAPLCSAVLCCAGGCAGARARVDCPARHTPALRGGVPSDAHTFASVIGGSALYAVPPPRELCPQQHK